MNKHSIPPCGCCKRQVKRRFISNAKARYRHKCPHGEWCVTGQMPYGMHANEPWCRQCQHERRMEELARTA